MKPSHHFPLLRIALPADDDWTKLAWLGFSAERMLSARGENYPAELPSADEMEILLPARCVSVHRLDLPAQAGKHLDSLIGQALEDRLLGDKTDVLAIPGMQRGTERLVWVCRRQWLEKGLEKLTKAGRFPDRLVPQYGLLPEEPDATTCATVSGGVVFRTSTGQMGIAGNEETAAALSGSVPLRPIADLDAQPSPEHGSSPLPRSLAHFAKQGFNPRQLRAAGVLLAVWAVLALLGATIHWRQLESRTDHLQHEIRQTFATAFPGTPIVDPIMQWESKQREARQGQGDALDAMTYLAARLNIPLHPRRIEAGDGFVRLVLTDSEFAQFKTQLEAAGKPETAPAESGLIALTYRLGQSPR